MEWVGWTDHARDEGVKEDGNIIHGIKIGTLTGLVRTWVGTAF